MGCYSVQVDIDSPPIAVIGHQSAGKSSLIEAISGITLPRSAGTCTRYDFILLHRLECKKTNIQLIIVVQLSVVSYVRSHLGNVLSHFDS